MVDSSYWLDLFTPTTWKEFIEAGGTVSGFRESRWNILQKIKVGDYFLCYLTGVSRWIGVLEVASAPFRDTTPIWKDESFPCRVKVKIVGKLTPEDRNPGQRDARSALRFSDNDGRRARMDRALSGLPDEVEDF